MIESWIDSLKYLAWNCIIPVNYKRVYFYSTSYLNRIMFVLTTFTHYKFHIRCYGQIVKTSQCPGKQSQKKCQSTFGCLLRWGIRHYCELADYCTILWLSKETRVPHNFRIEPIKGTFNEWISFYSLRNSYQFLIKYIYLFNLVYAILGFFNFTLYKSRDMSVLVTNLAKN